MQNLPQSDIKGEVKQELHTWRHHAVNILLYVVVAGFTPVIVIWVYQFAQSQSGASATIFYLVVFVILGVLAFFPNLDHRIKAWSIVALGYGTSITALILGGLAGDGRIYLMMTPILALILIGTAAGIVTAVLCLNTYAAIALLAHRGWIESRLLITENPLFLVTWLQEGVVVAVCLAIILVLMWRFKKTFELIAVEKAHLFFAVQESESRYKAISEMISDLAYCVKFISPDQVELEWATDTPTRSVQFDIEDIIHSGGLGRLVYPADLHIAQASLYRVLNGKTDIAEFRIVTKEDEILWVSHYCRPVWDETENRVVRLFGAIQDITERKNAALELSASEDRYQSLFNRIPIGIYRTASDGKIIDANPALRKILGIRNSIDLNEVNAKDFYVEPTIRNGINSQLDSDEIARDFEIQLQRKDGDIIWVEDNVQAIQDTEGNLISYEGTLQDITPRKEAEKQSRLHAEALEKQNLELNRLYRASEALIYGRTPEINQLAKSIVEMVLSEFGKSNCSLILIEGDQDGHQLNRIAVAGSYSQEVSRGSLSLEGRGIVPRAIRTKEIINIPDVSQEPDYVPNWEAARSEMAIPLKIGDTVIGVIDVQSAAIAAFNPDDERLMSIFAERAALAIENARLNQQTHNRLNRLSALRHIDTAIANTFDIHLTLNILLTEVTQQLRVDAAAVLLYNPALQIFHFGAEQGFRTSALKHTNLRLGRGYAGKAAQERRIIHIKDIRAPRDSLKDSKLLPDENFISYYGVPLIAKGEIQGVLEIFHRSFLEGSAEWLEFLETLAGQAAIAIDNATLFTNLEIANDELIAAYDTTLEGWAKALELRDGETEGHCRRVTDMTLKLAQIVGINGEATIHVRRGALLHDIGKMGVPDSILLKPGPLTNAEWSIMREHPNYAQQFLSGIDFLRPAMAIPYCHHEKWDGTGYPQGLRGEDIPLPARVFSIVDVWDALSSDRPYRKAWEHVRVLDYLQEQAGQHFDPQIVTPFIEILNTGV